MCIPSPNTGIARLQGRVISISIAAIFYHARFGGVNGAGPAAERARRGGLPCRMHAGAAIEGAAGALRLPAGPIVSLQRPVPFTS